MKNKILKFIKNPGSLFISLGNHGFFNWLDDAIYLKIAYFIHFKKRLNLKNPQTFSEKLQWLKLYNRNPLYTTLVDKYAVKKWVADKIGEEYVIPTLGVWDKVEDIDFDKLPSQFVLKCTHDSGSVVICRDKKKFNKKEAIKKLSRGLKHSGYYYGREWPYKNVPRRIIAEKYIEDTDGQELRDYKFFCFNGDPKFMYISNDRGVDPHTDFFDMEKRPLPFRLKDPPSKHVPHIPEQFEQMKDLATSLSNGIAHVRVDFYLVNKKIYIGELTFFHNGGFTIFTPSVWDKKIGDLLKLPTK